MRGPCFVVALALLATRTLWAQTKQLSGAGTCGKPDVSHAIRVADRPDHVFAIAQTRCRWTKPFEIGGIRSKQGTGVQFDEIRGDSTQFRGYYLDAMSNGDTVQYHYAGSTILKAGAPQSAMWNWLFVGGTGKLRGLRGKGACQGKWSAAGLYTWECTGAYQLSN